MYFIMVGLKNEADPNIGPGTTQIAQLKVRLEQRLLFINLVLFPALSFNRSGSRKMWKISVTVIVTLHYFRNGQKLMQPW